MINEVSAEVSTDERAERRSYIVGFALATGLTIVAFGLVILQVLPAGTMLATLGVLAAVQIAVHLRCFLHIDHVKSHRDDLRLVLLTIVILAVIIGGTVWILWDQHMRMMM